MSMLPDSLQEHVLSCLDAVDRVKLASVCAGAKPLGLTEGQYIHEVRARFTTLVPTFSGKQLRLYRSLGFVCDPDSAQARHWFL